MCFSFTDDTFTRPACINATMNVRTVCVLLLVLSLVLPTSAGWLFRRRRRHCSARHCVWHNWGRWSECDKVCGGHGVQFRQRTKAQTADCGGKGCAGLREEKRSCNRMCYNGGSLQMDGRCVCASRYYGLCCEHHFNPLKSAAKAN